MIAGETVGPRWWRIALRHGDFCVFFRVLFLVPAGEEKKSWEDFYVLDCISASVCCIMVQTEAFWTPRFFGVRSGSQGTGGGDVRRVAGDRVNI